MEQVERYNYVFEQYDGDSFIYDSKEGERIDDLSQCAYILNKYETKLAESEKFMQANGFKNWKETQDALNGKFECIFDEKHELWKKVVAENAQLKQQLSDKEKEVQKWKNKKVKYIVDNIICDRNQTAIDELEKVRSKIARLDVSPDESNRLIPALDNYTNGFHKSRFKIVNILDQQIKSLKGEK